VPVGVTGHRTQRPRGQVGPPGPHPAQLSSSLGPGGERWPIFRPLAPLIAQLVTLFAGTYCDVVVCRESLASGMPGPAAELARRGRGVK
jgi:hypothetical protein